MKYYIKKQVSKVLTSLSPSRSTRQFKKPVWPTVTVTFRWTLKSKYGSSAAGDIVVSDVLSETRMKFNDKE